MVALYTSRDRAINEPLANAGKSATRYPTFAEAFGAMLHAWDELWEVCDVRLPGEQRVQFLLRLHISHLLQTCSRLTPHHDAGVPARGLNGEAYRGHVFWDELYVYPFLNYRLPEITRGLLMYRYRRIGEARAAAEAAGFRRRDVSRGRAGATARRRRRSSTSTRCRGDGSRTSAATSAT